MSVYVFVGPTVSVDEARRHLDAVYLGPVAQGDVVRLLERRPRAIGIVDGYFHHAPAVLHKEILWAMSKGVHVLGSASMGALRAAELAPFGMIGVGAIFRAFRDGVFTDDDEVTVAHGAAEDGYRPVSEAMVNIRRTLGEAVAQGVIGRPSLLKLQQIAKEVFYPERSFRDLLRRAAEDVPEAELSRLRAWLPAGRIDQKREDALEMLRAMSELVARDPGPMQTDFPFAYTEFWDRARRRSRPLPAVGSAAAGASSAAAADATSDAASGDRALDELRLAPRAYEAARHGALLRALSLDMARRLDLRAAPEAVEAELSVFCGEHGLSEPDALDAWLRERRLDRATFARLIEEQAVLRQIAALFDGEAQHALPDHLQVTSDYAALSARARDKQEALSRSAHDSPLLADVRLDEGALWRWYFVDRLGFSAVPDVEAHAASVGYHDKHGLLRAVLREYVFVAQGAPATATSFGGHRAK